MTLQNRLMLFYFVTALGSALSGTASFLSLENFFHSLIFLGFALSARTFASASFSYIANHLIHRFGLHACLLFSQLFGCLSLAVLYVGFNFHQFSITIMGIVLAGIPFAFVSILLNVILRISSEDHKIFRKYSGRRELVFGIAMLLSSLLAPLLLYKYNLNIVLLVDAISYFLGILLIANLTIKGQADLDAKNKPVSLRKLISSSRPAQAFFFKTSAALLLAGLLPLLASSGKIAFTEHMPVLMRQWLWAIEDVTAISASLVYLIFSILQTQKRFEDFLMLSAVFLIIPLLYLSNESVILTIVVICLLTDFANQKFRDDLIVSAGQNTDLIHAHSALAQFQRNFIFFLSPLILTLLFTYTNIVVSVVILISMQCVFYLIYKKFYTTPWVDCVAISE